MYMDVDITKGHHHECLPSSTPYFISTVFVMLCNLTSSLILFSPGLSACQSYIHVCNHLSSSSLLMNCGRCCGCFCTCVSMATACPPSTLQIERVVNPKIWERYVYRKREVAESNNSFANERMLFHGEMGCLLLLLLL